MERGTKRHHYRKQQRVLAEIYMAEELEKIGFKRFQMFYVINKISHSDSCSFIINFNKLLDKNKHYFSKVFHQK